MAANLLIVLDCYNFFEVQMKKELVHDGGRMLRYCLERMSIPREGWKHTYAYKGQKKDLPTRKKERWTFLATSMEELGRSIQKELIRVPESNTEVLAVGRLACECLTGSSEIGKRAGTCWKPRKEWQETGLRRVWVSYSTDGALFDPALVTSIYGTIATAAKAAGFVLQHKTPQQLTPFDWSEYI